MIWENSIETYVKQITSPDFMHETGSGGQDGEHMYTHGWLMSIYGKNHYNILK